MRERTAADLKSEDTRKQQKQKMMRYGQMQIGRGAGSHRKFSSVFLKQ
jgi:hypothetical protein